MRVTMQYGKTGLPVELPDDWDVTIIRKNPMPRYPDPAESVVDALSNPVSSGTIHEEAKGCRSACILICDITRPVPNNLLIPALVRDLLDAGMDAGRITILVATGLHRPNEGCELEELIGDEWVLKSVNVANHFALDDSAHVYLGDTSRGIPAKIDRRFIEADLRIVTGLVEPHFMAGYSGGRKVIVPGIAHADTITRLHSAQLLEHPNAANCVLDSNPFHAEQMEIIGMIGRSLAVNVVIDEHRNLSFVNFGEIVDSHAQAVNFMEQYAKVSIDQRFGTVLTSAAGYPLDKTYYQTVKGMVGAMNILEQGGNMFIVSECSEGMGSSHYVQAQKELCRLGTVGFKDSLLSRSQAMIDEWQTEMQLKAMAVGNLHIFSGGLSKADSDLTGIRAIESLIEALAESVSSSGNNRIAVIPEGPYVIPVYSYSNP